MKMRPFHSLESRSALLPVDNIDTDRIIPARFLKTTVQEGLGEHLFADWQTGRDALGEVEILAVGHNFGCGSSREHAVWALLDAGVRVVVSTGFADIFHANAMRNGLVPVILEPGNHQKLFSVLMAEASETVSIDLENQTLSCGPLETEFPFDGFAKHCITNGIDELGFLLQQAPNIAGFEGDNQPCINTKGDM